MSARSPSPAHSSPRVTAQIALLLAAVVLGMSPWFSATVVARAMVGEWTASAAGPTGVGAGAAGIWLTLGVQVGFVAGSVLSAATLLADRLRPARLAGWCSLVAAVATAALALPGVRYEGAVLLRVVVGASLSGVYPPGIKLAAGWTNTRRGTAIGALVGGTTLGSAMPHLLAVAVPASAWRSLVVLASACAVGGALLFLFFVREGPFQSPSAPFDPRAIGEVFRSRGARLATLGYLGHMWELYAMWSAIGPFWQAAAVLYALGSWAPPVIAFASISAGAIGSVIAGRLADAVDRSTITIVAMAISATCAVVIGPSLGAPMLIPILISIVWGAAVVADSAQFSAAVTEFSPARYVGTAVTVQTATGFLLTMVTIRLVPMWAQSWGWERAFLPLALGPILGIVAMARLRPLERQARKAGGRGV